MKDLNIMLSDFVNLFLYLTIKHEQFVNFLNLFNICRNEHVILYTINELNTNFLVGWSAFEKHVIKLYRKFYFKIISKTLTSYHVDSFEF